MIKVHEIHVDFQLGLNNSVVVKIRTWLTNWIITRHIYFRFLIYQKNLKVVLNWQSVNMALITNILVFWDLKNQKNYILVTKRKHIMKIRVSDESAL